MDQYKVDMVTFVLEVSGNTISIPISTGRFPFPCINIFIPI